MNAIVKTIGLVLLLAVFSGGAAAKTLKFATLAPAGTAWMKEMKAGAKAIRQRTDGRVKIKFYPGGVMGNDQSVHRKIKIGQLHGGAFTPGALSHIDSGIQALGLPMMFNNLAEVDYVREGLDDMMKQRMEDSGFVILGISEGGFARILSQRPMRDLETIRESKVWIPEGDNISKVVFETMGVSPISLPIADVFTGLQTGLIETIAANPTSAIAFQWHTSMSHMNDTPIVFLIGVLAVQKKTFDKLDPADQAVVREEMGKVFERLDEINREDEIAAEQALRNQGIEIVVTDPAEVERWKKYADESIAGMIESGAVPADIVSRVQQRLQEYRSRQ
jgi:TRAP-type transport system periplasmic protein